MDQSIDPADGTVTEMRRLAERWIEEHGPARSTASSDPRRAAFLTVAEDAYNSVLADAGVEQVQTWPEEVYL